MMGNNAQVVGQDDQGVFIRIGTMKYRPKTNEDLGGAARGKVVRAWKASDLPGDMMKVQTPRGQKVWARRD